MESADERSETRRSKKATDERSEGGRGKEAANERELSSRETGREQRSRRNSGGGGLLRTAAADTGKRSMRQTAMTDPDPNYGRKNSQADERSETRRSKEAADERSESGRRKEAAAERGSAPRETGREAEAADEPLARGGANILNRDKIGGADSALKAGGNAAAIGGARHKVDGSGKQAAAAIMPPLGRGQAEQSRARADGGSPADKGEKRSLLKNLFGFLGKNQNGRADKSRAEHEAAEKPQTGWTAQERLMIANIAELHEARAGDVMIPRAEIEALDLDRSLADILRLFAQSGHSRIPVYAETLDDPRGMVHIRDVLDYITRFTLGEAADSAEKSGEASAALDLSRPINELGIIREVLFVPASMPAGRLLARMQAGRQQIALVIDEHGGTDGLVSMEDIVELIVGDIEDEHDEDDEDFVREAQDSWIIDAGAELEELKDSLGIDFSGNPLAESVDTLGGLIVSALDRIPARGEKGEIAPNYMFHVLDADRRRIKRVRLTRRQAPLQG